jgi:uncharacterized protein (TIGR02246 family)
VDKDKTNPKPAASSSDSPLLDSPVDELYRKLQPEMRRPKPSPDAIAAALESAQRLAAEADAEDASDDLTHEIAADSSAVVCSVCGYRNREGTKFCGMCGIAVALPTVAATNSAEGEYQAPQAIVQSPNSFLERDMRPPTTRPTGQETHHYHHHYHHHYFPGAQEGSFPRAADAAREDKLRPTAGHRGDMSRSEAAVRRITQEWVLACNTKHLDDLLELYISDALVLRSNYPPIRGAAAIREFFFGALDAGLGEVEVDPMRVDVVGDLAYEAGRCKALIPGATGKRREERGKYLWVFSRQSNGEWKLAADCWSSDLTLSGLESDVPPTSGVRTSQPRKNS